ncbi:MAG TPA: hypothetical protein VF796_04035 [Humisphaera sp.]
MGDVLAQGGNGFVPVFVVIALLVGLVSIAWNSGAGERMLDRWAAANGYTLLSAEHRWLAQGPFWWRTSKNQSVYRISVRDAAGEVRTGWARCGGWFLGMMSDQVDVEWDAPPDRREPPGFPVVMPGDRRPPDA